MAESGKIKFSWAAQVSRPDPEEAPIKGAPSSASPALLALTKG